MSRESSRRWTRKLYGDSPRLIITNCGNLPYIRLYWEARMARTMKLPIRSKRLEIRATPDQKKLFERAAQLRGTSLTDFAVDKLQEAATEIIQETESLRLREEDRKVFFHALTNPPAPNEYAKSAVARYKRQVRS